MEQSTRSQKSDEGKNYARDVAFRGGLVETDIYKYNHLLRTETSYVVNRADLEVAKNFGIEKRKFVATLDSRTSSKCREQHNKIVYIKDTVIGVNTPPLHPFCRSIMVDYIPGLSDDREWEEKRYTPVEGKEYSFIDNENIFKIANDSKNIDFKTDVARAWIDYVNKDKGVLKQDLTIATN